MSKQLIKISIFVLFFISIFYCQSFAASLENLEIGVNKGVIYPEETVKVTIDFGRNLSEFEINVAYDKNLFEYYSSNQDINLNDNGDVVTLSYPTISTKDNISNIEIEFKAKKNIITTNPTDLKVTLQKMKDGLTEEILENPLLPFENNLVVEPIYKDYNFVLEYDKEKIKPNEEIDLKLSLKSEMGQIYKNTKIYATVTSDMEGEVKITGYDSFGEKYDILKDGWGGENGEPIGGINISKDLNFIGEFSDFGEYKLTFELRDLNNQDIVLAQKTFDIKISDELETESGNTNTVGLKNEIGNNLNLVSETNTIQNEVKSISNTLEYKETTLPKAGSTIYFLLFPAIGILILIYCMFKKKDEEY